MIIQTDVKCLYCGHVSWRVEMDTYDLASPAGSAAARYAGDHVTVGPRSVVVLLSPR